MKLKSTIKWFACVLLCQVAGGISAFWTTPEIPHWYASLQKPSFNPPNWIFGPVWTLLFMLMGTGLWYTVSAERSHPARTRAIVSFIVQLGLNVLWSLLFFKLHSPFAAFIEIVLLWGSILIWIISIFPISKTAGWINTPYLAWVGFATLLNFWIWKLNV